ncbi:Rbpj-Interacting And Tubulin-Associated Protein 1 [Manis pentadactyla]|nr:Rbpj-Interacting And Tubulin-Associated Protein 1 [Manis pentadactyla]
MFVKCSVHSARASPGHPSMRQGHDAVHWKGSCETTVTAQMAPSWVDLYCLPGMKPLTCTPSLHHAHHYLGVRLLTILFAAPRLWDLCVKQKRRRQCKNTGRAVTSASAERGWTRQQQAGTGCVHSTVTAHSGALELRSAPSFIVQTLFEH